MTTLHAQLLLLVALSTNFLFVAASDASTVRRLDLSYLHRCGEEALSKVIEGTLGQRTRKENSPIEDQSDTIIDIDLTASLIGKNLSSILSSLQREEDDLFENEDDSIAIRLTVRRNQWSPREATKILDFVAQNGPTNQTAEEFEVRNETVTAVSPDASNEDSPTIDKNSTGDGKDSELPEEGGSTESPNEDNSFPQAHGKKFLSRPAFVSIQSLDLGWNNLGSDLTNSRRGASAIRNVNKALRTLLSDTKQCPPTLRLDVCGLGPPACREMAKGVVERYDADASSVGFPPPITLNLARNEGIGDVGVAALAAGIRTVASKQYQGAVDTKEKKRKRKRKKKRRSSEMQSTDDEIVGETDQEIEVTKSDNNDEIEVEKTDEGSKVEEGVTSVDSQTEIEPIIIFERLDLSGCGISDVGAEALAIALRNHPLCIKHLDLSNNKISDEGAAALARALGMADEPDDSSSGRVESLDLSHNKDLGDRGAKELAKAFGTNGISNLILRSCNVRADGASHFGAALQTIGGQATAQSARRVLDLSGNPLGILSKKKKSGSKLSATALRSKATDTTKAYMNLIGKSLQKGLNSINNLGNGDGSFDTLESDDEEEERLGVDDEEEDESRNKCGALSLAEAFLDQKEAENESENSDSEPSVHVDLGLRHCSFDTKAAEALAAVLQESRQKYPTMKLTMDMTMNDVLEEDIISALHGEEGYEDQLADMAEVYLDALEVLREARARALKAAQMAAARARAQAEREAAWGAPPPGSRYRNDAEEEWSEDEIEPGEWDHPNADEEEDYSDQEW